MSDCYRIVLGSNSLSSIRSNPHRAYRGFGHQETQIKTFCYNKISITFVQFLKVLWTRKKIFENFDLRIFRIFRIEISEFQNVDFQGVSKNICSK